MKKIISTILIVLIIFNFICGSCANKVYASEMEEDSSSLIKPGSAPISNTAGVSIIEEGKVGSTQGAAANVTLNALSVGVSAIGMILGILARVLNVLIFMVIDIILGMLTGTTEETTDGTVDKFWFTIERCVYNRIPLFNINYLNTGDTYEVGTLTLNQEPTNIEIKKGITNIYYICRMLSISLSLLVLIYIGIRMAISTVSSEQAKYKKMLVSWIESIVLLFLMIYIVSALITFGEKLTGAFYNLEQQLLENNTGEKLLFEDTIRYDALLKMHDLSGLELALYAIIYWALLFMEIKFFWLYTKRLLMVGLLIVLSPLITITYSIDKVGDGKAQAFSMWFKELTVNVLIQPLHALIYMIFVLTANNIAASSPLMALALLWSMGAVEKMVRVIFKMNVETLKGIDMFAKKEG